ncbi:MAG: LUD domain-containing protein, partial [Desulfatiglandales bacterium]
MAEDRWPYRKKARQALSNPIFQRGLENIQLRIGKATLERYRELPNIEELRDKGREIRLKAVDNLGIYLERFAQNVERMGGVVFFAKDGDEAKDFALKVCHAHKVKRVVKGKSMVGEEIGINRALEERGIVATETDLGEYIIQLAGEGPSHIIGPAIHKSKEEIGRLFSERLKAPYSTVPEELTSVARNSLRPKFLEADMGITGANLAIAETGQVMLVSNEGNIRF